MMTHSIDEPVGYTIIVKSHVDLAWRDWFDDFDIVHGDDGNTSLRGVVADQTALYGILKRINQLGLTLIAVNPILCKGAPP